MHEASFLQDLAVVMIAAGLVSVMFHILRLPVLLGYILAGVLIGPHALPSPLVSDEESIHTLAGLGIIFLLFAIGLEFNFRKIRQIGMTTFIVAPLETGLMFLIGHQIGRAFGWGGADSVYLGGILMISSTTIIAKTLKELGLHKESFAQAIFGILIVEDIIAILLIASLSGVAVTGTLDWGAVVGITGQLGIFLVMVVVVGLLAVPKLFRVIDRFRSDETLLIVTLGLCFGLALMAVKLNYSVGLGAFIMGAIIAESHDIRRVERLTGPLRDMFSAVFFVAIGLLIDPKVAWEYAGPVAIISVALVGGKIVACSFGCFVAGYDRATALRVGLGLAQIGEFSFIIAALGASLGVTSGFLYPIAVTVSVLTTILTPFLIRHSDRLIALHDRLAPQSWLSYLQDYTAWLARWQVTRPASPPRRLLRIMLVQIGINVALIAGLFLGAAIVDRQEFGWLNDLPAWTGGRRTVLWLAAMVISLPIGIATLRKLQAFGMLTSEMAVHRRASPKATVAMRALVANTTLFAGMVGLAILILLFSSFLLPPWEVLVVLLGIVILTALLLRTFFIRVYSRAQYSIREVLSREPPRSPPPPAAPVVPSLLENARLVTVILRPGTRAVGRQIRELELRTRTGATAVAVRRGSETIVSPEPELEFRPQDEVLLIGNDVQLARAREWLDGSGEAQSA
jgi:CPA2 family monovalent cation:H+ antiporter-2